MNSWVSHTLPFLSSPIRPNTSILFFSRPISRFATAGQQLFFFSNMSRVPFEVEKIPLTGFPIGQKVRLSIESSSTLATQKADLFVAAIPPTAESVSSESKDTDEDKPKVFATISPSVDIQGELGHLISRQEFIAAEGKTAVVRLPANSQFAEVGLLGLGSGSADQSTIIDGFCMKKGVPRGLSSFAASKLGKPLASLITTVKAKSVILHIDASSLCPASLQSLVESVLIANSPDERFKSKKDDASSLESFTVLVNGDVEQYASVMQIAKEVASGVQLARELTGAPPNYCNPETLAQAAIQTAKDYGLTYKVLGEKECIERKMGSYLSVNQGSIYAPQFIHLTYLPEGEVKKRIAFVGKGVCMDTGGYNLKTLGGINTMKMDMGGAAAVFGAAQIIGSLKPKNIEVHFVVPAAENMIDSKAFRPGDVVTASNGKTIEIGNTDAEGRLTLADALVYTENDIKPDMILDCATLTGACLIGLGMNIAALYGSDDEWMNTVQKAAKTAGSPIWPMPLFSDYSKANESKCADLSNIARVRTGGSIQAALFLKEFVKETPWVHIDLAGPVYDSDTDEFTGYGTKLFAQIVIDMSK